LKAYINKPGTNHTRKCPNYNTRIQNIVLKIKKNSFNGDICVAGTDFRETVSA